MFNDTALSCLVGSQVQKDRQRATCAIMADVSLQDELLDVEGRIDEVITLMRVERVDEKLEKARLLRDKHNCDWTSAYLLEHKKGAVTTTRHTQAHLALGDILKTKIKLCQYTESLEDTLRRLSEQRVALLERILEIRLRERD